MNVLYLLDMKNQLYIWIPLLLLAVLAISIFATMNPVFPYSYLLWIAGMVLLVIAVFKVLHYKRKSNKTFKDWYEDDPRKTK